MLVRRVLHGAAAPVHKQLRFKRSEAVADAKRMSLKIPISSKGTMGMSQQKLQEVVPELFPDGAVDPSHRAKAMEAMNAAVSKATDGTVDAAKVEPVKAASVKAEPVQAASVEAEPVQAASVKAEPVQAASVKAEPAVVAEPVKTELPASFTNAFTTIFKKISDKTSSSDASTEAKPPSVEATLAASRPTESTAPPVTNRHPHSRVARKTEQTPANESASATRSQMSAPAQTPRATPTSVQRDVSPTGGGGGGLAAAFLKVKADLEEKVQTLEAKLKLLSCTPAPSAGIPLPTALQYEVMKASAEDTEVSLAVEGVAGREFMGCINRVDVAGVMGRPSTKLWQTGIVTEFSITTTQQRMEMKGGGLLTERELHKVYVHGSTIARFIMSNARQGYLVHVQGRLTGFPRWSEDEGKMVHTHAINVHPESGGNFTILRGPVANQDAVFNSLEHQATVRAATERKKRSEADNKATAPAVQEPEVRTPKVRTPEVRTPEVQHSEVSPRETKKQRRARIRGEELAAKRAKQEAREAKERKNREQKKAAKQLRHAELQAKQQKQSNRSKLDKQAKKQRKAEQRK